MGDKASILLKLLESPSLDTASHDIQNLKTRIHNHEISIRLIQAKPPKDAGEKERRLNYHKGAIDHLGNELKQKQDQFYQLNHPSSDTSRNL